MIAEKKRISFEDLVRQTLGRYDASLMVCHHFYSIFSHRIKKQAASQALLDECMASPGVVLQTERCNMTL